MNPHNSNFVEIVITPENVALTREKITAMSDGEVIGLALLESQQKQDGLSVVCLHLLIDEINGRGLDLSTHKPTTGEVFYRAGSLAPKKSIFEGLS